MKPTHFLPLILVLFFFISCSSDQDFRMGEEKVYQEQDMQQMRQSAVDMPMPAPDAPMIDRQVIRTGNLTFETQDLEQTRQRVEEAVKATGAHISNEQELKYEDRINQILTIRVPADSFDVLVEQISRDVVRFDVRNVDTRDVTEEYIDVETRIRTKKQLEQRFLDLLQKANEVKEIIEIERELANLRSDIESMETRFRYLSDQITYSTLSVTFYENISDIIGFGRKVQDGFRSGWENFVQLIIVLIHLWPFVLLLFGTVVLYIAMRRRRYR